MAQFTDVHHGMKGITAEQLQQAHQADLAMEEDEGVHFERASADPESGTVYGLSEAPGGRDRRAPVRKKVRLIRPSG